MAMFAFKNTPKIDETAVSEIILKLKSLIVSKLKSDFYDDKYKK